ncbi:hypothetical protein [Streptomyces sp. G1]|uniref:hypothetical protein n=1 Tax=Streptomyces sp. G1 TaxID=361572 RepID=UPI00202E6C4E|nr:hypothetical protein [Streptomyces sp. G1]MCM1969152.1 hypothetical protein [Streptomyces sp. G1]
MTAPTAAGGPSDVTAAPDVLLGTEDAVHRALRPQVPHLPPDDRALLVRPR